MLGGGGQFEKQQVIENNQTNKSQLSPVFFLEGLRDASHIKLAKMKPEKHAHTLKAGDPPTYYKPKTHTAEQKKKERQCTLFSACRQSSQGLG